MRLVPLKQRPPVSVFRRGQLIPPKRQPRTPGNPNPPPAPPAAMPWDHFTTHAQIDDWVMHWQDDHALVLPAGWDGLTLTGKRQWLNANVDPSP